MEYAIYILAALFLVFIIIYRRGKKDAVDFLVINYGLSRKKINNLSNIQITGLTASLRSLEQNGNTVELHRLISLFKEEA